VSVDYADVTGTKPPADADNTVDAVEAGATVTSGGITFSAGGAIKGGQTDYNTGTGWFLGYSGGGYKFSVGDPSGNHISWDGSSWTVVGIGGAYTAGDVAILGPTGQFHAIGQNAQKYYQFTIGQSGFVRAKMQVKGATGQNGYYRIYKNGQILVSSFVPGNGTYYWVSLDIYVNCGDIILLMVINDGFDYTYGNLAQICVGNTNGMSGPF
jgi:hypothetical protein